MKKLIVCALTAAVVAQIWGMISWTALPWHMLDFKQFKDETVVVSAFQSELQGTGLYTLPNMDPAVHQDEAAMKAWNEQARRGPFAFISVQADGVEPGMGLPIALGFLLNLVIAGILFWLLGNSSLSSVKDRTIFIAVAGSVGALYPHLSNLIWWHFPPSYCIVAVIDLLITWALAGFAMVKLSDKLSTKENAA